MPEFWRWIKKCCRFRKFPVCTIFLAFLMFPISPSVFANPVTFDLAADWSDVQNGGSNPWSYREGTNLLPHVSDWIAGGYSVTQPAWANAPSGVGHVPAIWKLTQASADAQIGDVIVHDTDNARPGENFGPANILWTSTIAGTVNIVGSVWHIANDNRGSSWSLYLNNTLLTTGVVAGGDPYSRASPFNFSNGSGGSQAHS